MESIGSKWDKTHVLSTTQAFELTTWPSQKRASFLYFASWSFCPRQLNLVQGLRMLLLDAHSQRPHLVGVVLADSPLGCCEVSCSAVATSAPYQRAGQSSPRKGQQCSITGKSRHKMKTGFLTWIHSLQNGLNLIQIFCWRQTAKLSSRPNSSSREWSKHIPVLLLSLHLLRVNEMPNAFKPSFAAELKWM